MRRLILYLTLFGFTLLVSAGAAWAQTNLLSNGDFVQETAEWEIVGSERIRATPIAVMGQPFRRALRLTLDPNPSSPAYTLVLRQPIEARLRQGEQIVIRAWVRSPGSNKIGVFFEQNAPPHNKSLGRELVLSPEWKEYEISGAAYATYGPNESAITIHLGYAAGVVEIANVRLTKDAGTAAATRPGTTPVNGTTNAPDALLNGDFTSGNQGWNMTGLDRTTVNLVRAEAGPFRQAVRLQVTPKEGDNPWTVSLQQPLNVEVKKDDPLLLGVWIRSPESARVGLFLEQSTEPYWKLIAGEMTLSPQWREIWLTGISPRDFAKGETRLNFHLAYGAGTIEVAGIRLAAGRSAALPLDPNSLLINGDFARSTAAWTMSPDIRWNTLDAQAGPFRQTLQLDVSAGDKPWSQTLKQTLTMGLRRDTPVTLKVWMRSPQNNRVTVMLEESKSPYSRSLGGDFTLTSQWKEYELRGIVPKDYTPGELALTFHLARDTGSIQITGVRLLLAEKTTTAALENAPR